MTIKHTPVFARRNSIRLILTPTILCIYWMLSLNALTQAFPLGRLKNTAIARCPCFLSISAPLNATSATVSIHVRTIDLPRGWILQHKFNVSAHDATYLTDVHAVHELQISSRKLVRVQAVGSDVGIRLTTSMKSNTCPSLLPEHSIGDRGVTEQHAVPRIVGGDIAHPELVPYLVRISSPSEDQWLMCSGVLISPLHVLTAAHCRPSTESTVHLGLADSSEMSPDNAYSVEKVQIPPEYDETRFSYDIAVVTLTPNENHNSRADGLNYSSSSTTTKKKWMKVNINNDIPKTWSIVRVAGYGNTNGDVSGPSNSVRALYQVDLPVVSAEHCEPMYGNAVDYKYQVCAGYVGRGGCDACQGDSGGPMFQYDSHGNPVVVGVVSMSLATDCGSPRVPGAYVRTAPHAYIFAEKPGVEMVTETNVVMSEYRPPPTFRRVMILVFASVAAVVAVIFGAVSIVRLGKRWHGRNSRDTVTTDTIVQDDPQPPPSPPTSIQQPLSIQTEPPPPSSPPSGLLNPPSNLPDAAAALTVTEQLHASRSELPHVTSRNSEDNDALRFFDVRLREPCQSTVGMSTAYDPHVCTGVSPEATEAVEESKRQTPV